VMMARMPIRSRTSSTVFRPLWLRCAGKKPRFPTITPSVSGFCFALYGRGGCPPAVVKGVFSPSLSALGLDPMDLPLFDDCRTSDHALDIFAGPSACDQFQLQ